MAAAGLNVVTGGLGYIGQSIAARLAAIGEPVVLIDRRRIPAQVSGAPIVLGDIREAHVWDALTDCPLRAVFHCAGLIQVGESVNHPARYFDDNVVAGLAMLEHVRRRGPIPVIFSSSAAVYGIPEGTPISESAPLRPISPYGVTKRQFEEVLEAYNRAYGIPYMALRYFNAAGTDGAVHENHQPETHLLPRVARAIRSGQAPVIYGNDYPTADGTAVRDYVHMTDLVNAHLAARRYLESGGESLAVNVGSGHGISVWEMLEAFRRQVPDMPEPTVVGRRPGDPPVLVAAIERARYLLDWRPAWSDVDRLVAEAWDGSPLR